MKKTVNKSRSVVWGHVRDILIVILIGNFAWFMFQHDIIFSLKKLMTVTAYSAMIGTALWKGNEGLSHIIYKYYDINKEPVKTLWVSLVLMFVYTVIAIVVVNYIWYVLIWGQSVSFMLLNSRFAMIIQLGITFIIVATFLSIGFFQAWRESAVNEERLQKDSIKFQYKALKNQINPHFLFNSLNSLTSLVYKDQDQAAKFIKQLSEVYRYVLEHKENEVVSLKEEINFSEKYIFLQKIRHDKSLQVNITANGTNDKYIVPVSMQLLIENAIKHNEVSEENPLVIKIYEKDDYVWVENNLQPKVAIKESGGVGLETIKDRYAFLSDKKVIITQTDKSFIVQLPLIKTKHHEGSDH